MTIQDNHTHVSIVAEIDPDMEQMTHQRNEGLLPILPLRDNILFPGTILPVNIGRKSSLALVKMAENGEKLIGVFAQRDPKTDMPAHISDMYRHGVVARVLHSIEMPDGTQSTLIQALNRAVLVDFTSVKPYHRGNVIAIPEEAPNTATKFEITLKMFKEKTLEYLAMNDFTPQETLHNIKKMPPSPVLVNLTCSTLPIDIETKISLLEKNTMQERTEELMLYLNHEIQLLNIKRDIENKTQSDIERNQKEYFLNQQIRNIRAELGDKDEYGEKLEDQKKMEEKANSKKWSKAACDCFKKELARLQRLNVQSPDYSIQLNYLQTMLQLPWYDYTKDNLNLNTAKRTLDADHYGMEKIKERILEHMAVLKLRGDLKSPIICLYGPPGVGKTSLGKSIAKSLKRNYVRMSLGGLHDEAEIRGHRRTYIGAMPGMILKNIIKAESSNPVFILDEIDKVGQDSVHGDPASALLEVLDPEQNSAFHDNYLDMDYDLSRVMFIATANNINTIPRPLLDRMELIEVGGYITEEKVEIAKRHLVPKARVEVGMGNKKELKFTKDAIIYLIENHTRESGVRQLEKVIQKTLRKLAYEYAVNGKFETTSITTSEIKRLLGKPIYSRDCYQGNEFAGVVTGLAWTAVGGEILFIETSLSKGKGSKLTLTGSLGDVMKESAVLAVEYIKAHADNLGIDIRIFDHWNIHIHVPEGATPKDGPSAGITMVTALVSALTQRKVRKGIAMTGEITLRGKILPVGGIREKILAAKRAGIQDIVMCIENKKDIDEIPEEYLKGLTFHYVSTIDQVLGYALTEEKVRHAIDLSIPNEEEEKNR